MTSTAYTASGAAAPDMPISLAYSGTNAKNPAIPHSPSSTSTPGKRPAGWNSRSTHLSDVARRRSEHGRCRLGNQHCQARGHDRERARNDPHGIEARRGEDRLADRRAECEPDVERQRREVERLPAAALGREVARGGQHRDEEERLGGAEQRAGDDEEGQRIDGQVEGEGRRRQQRAEHQQRSPPEPIRAPAHDGTEQERTDRERPDRDADAGRRRRRGGLRRTGTQRGGPPRRP